MTTTILIIISSTLIGYSIYTQNKQLKRAKERSKQIHDLCNDIQRRCDRNLELIQFAIELRLKGDHRGSNLIDEDIRTNIVKLDKLEEKLNKICSYNN